MRGGVEVPRPAQFASFFKPTPRVAFACHREDLDRLVWGCQPGRAAHCSLAHEEAEVRLTMLRPLTPTIGGRSGRAKPPSNCGGRSAQGDAASRSRRDYPKRPRSWRQQPGNGHSTDAPTPLADRQPSTPRSPNGRGPGHLDALTPTGAVRRIPHIIRPLADHRCGRALKWGVAKCEPQVSGGCTAPSCCSL